MADVFSNLYIAHSIDWYHKNHKVSDILTDYCINRLLNENNTIINKETKNINALSKTLLENMNRHDRETIKTQLNLNQQIDTLS